MRKQRNMNACYWCHRPMIKNDPAFPIRDGRVRTKDHTHPASGGGEHTVPCCYACNQIKGNMPVREWISFMKANPNWWLLFRPGFQKEVAERRLVVLQILYPDRPAPSP